MSTRPGHYNRYIRAYRERHKAAGLCISCSAPAVRAHRCLKHWQAAQRHREIRYERRKAAGACVRCGMPHGTGHVHCAACLKRQQDSNAARTPDVRLRGPMPLLIGVDRIRKDELLAFWKMATKRCAHWLRTRTKAERRIVRGRLLGHPVGLRELGAELGVSHEWVRQIEMQLGAELKVWLDSVGGWTT